MEDRREEEGEKWRIGGEEEGRRKERKKVKERR